MELDINGISLKIDENNFMKSFIGELNKYLEKFNKNDKFKNESIEDMKLTEDEDRKFYRGQYDFLENYFEEELLDLSKGEPFLVTNKYENDYKYHRFKVAQYIDGHEYKYVTYAKELPKNVQLGDVVRKIDGKYIYDKQATQYVKNSLLKIKQDIINERNYKNQNMWMSRG